MTTLLLVPLSPLILCELQVVKFNNLQIIVTLQSRSSSIVSLDAPVISYALQCKDASPRVKIESCYLS